MFEFIFKKKKKSFIDKIKDLPFGILFGLFIIVSIITILMGNPLMHSIALPSNCHQIAKTVTMDYRITDSFYNKEKGTCVIKKQYPESKGDTSLYRKYQKTQVITEYPIAEFDAIQSEIYYSAKRFKDINYIK